MPKPPIIETGDITVSLLQRQPYCAKYTPRTPVIGFAFEVQSGLHAYGSSRRTGFSSIPNSLGFTPAGCDVYSESETGGEYLAIAISCSQLANSVLGYDRDLEPRPISDSVVSSAIHPARTLRRILLNSDEFELSEFESTCLSIIEDAYFAATHMSPIRTPASSITCPRLRTIEDYIQAKLHQPLSVLDMASLVGLSTGYFIRAFKARTGEPPHTYVMQRRVASARIKLEKSLHPIVNIAEECGFSSQAHMTTAFRKQLGTTPHAYRADRRGT